MTPAPYVKSRAGAPPGYFAWEAAGLRWLGEPGVVPVVEVLGQADDRLELRRLTPAAPTRAAARALGRGLAALHDAGAPGWGCGPDGWDGDGFFGPLHDPLPLPLGSWATWGAFWAEARIAPMVRRCRDAGLYDEQEAARLDRLAARVADGEHDTGDRPARTHGDLWSGNVVWTAGGATLIDPAAQGGHRENDLALLALFGAPHLDAVHEGYEEVHPLAPGRHERVGLHQLHCLLVHAELFGGGYARQALAVAR